MSFLQSLTQKQMNKNYENITYYTKIIGAIDAKAGSLCLIKLSLQTF